MIAVKSKLEIQSSFPPLRDYQSALYQRSNELDTNHIIQLPTGTGKGNLLLEIALNSIVNLEPTMIVVPSVELVHNLKERLEQNAPMLSSVCSYVGTGLRGNVRSPFLIGVYKTISNNLDKMPYFKRVIHDECHHSASDSWSKIFKAYPRSRHIGFTATPTRLDGRPLGDNFTDLITSPCVQWFIDQGYLSPFKLETAASIKLDKSFDDNLALQQQLFDNKQLMADIVNNWVKKAYGRKTIVFATGIEHAYHLCEEFNSRLVDTDLKFAVIHSKQNYKERDGLLRAFKSGKLTGLVNVAIVTEGVDVPDAEVCVLARFTQSCSLYLQMVGRVLRYVPGKIAYIFDHAGNALEHGSPAFEHEWTLKGLETKEKNDKCLCVACETPLITKSKVAKTGEVGIDFVCPVCDYPNHFVIIPEARLPRITIPGVIADGELIELTASPEEFKIYKIITSKRPHQKKIEAIIKLTVPYEMKVKGLQILGVSDDSIQILL